MSGSKEIKKPQTKKIMKELKNLEDVIKEINKTEELETEIINLKHINTTDLIMYDKKHSIYY